MNLIMLSGNSLHNKDWIEHAQIELSGEFDVTVVQDYAHWHTDDDQIDIEHEVEILKELVAEIDGPYGIFAKSIGTVLALHAYQQKIIQPEFMLFIGIPLSYILTEYAEFKEVLSSVDCPISIIHNSNDKVGSAQELAEYLGDDLVGTTRWNTPAGNTHDYENYQLLRSELDALIQTS